MTNLKNSGFSLSELVVVSLIMAIIAAIAIPVYIDMHKRVESESISNELSSFLVNARSDALIYHSGIVLCVADANDDCIATNGTKLISFIDENNNHSFDETIDVLRSKVELKAKYGYLVTRAALNKSYIELNSTNGRPIGYMGHIKYCPYDGDTTRMFKVSFNKAGIIKLKNNSDDPTNCNG